MNPDLPPWLHAAQAELRGAVEQDRLPHALLISGAVGVGKHWLGDWLIGLLHCRRPAGGRSCGQCETCRQHQAGSHPDLLKLEPEEAGKDIRIDAVRDACFELALTSRYSGYRVLVIQPADAMNWYSANALLKTLEEPPPNALLVLLTERPNALPATVRSRCRKIRLGTPPTASALAWLSQATGASETRARAALADCLGAPRPALALLQGAAKAGADTAAATPVGPLREALEAFLANRMEPVETAAALAGHGLEQVRGVLLAWMWQHSRAKAIAYFTPKPGKTAAQAVVYGQGDRLLFELWDELLHWPIGRSSGLEPQLMIEDMLIRLRWATVAGRRPRDSSRHRP